MDLRRAAQKDMIDGTGYGANACNKMGAFMSRTVTFVIPFLDEAENIPVLYEALHRIMADESESAEFLFVDDGSSDKGPAWLEEQAGKDSRIRLVRLSRNFGHQVAISAGLDLARGDAVIIIDADMQDPPETAAAMLEEWRKGAEVVCAVRASRAGEGFLKKLLASAFYRLFRRISKLDVPVDAGDFKLLDRTVVDALRGMRETHRYLRAMTAWAGFKQVSIKYDRCPRHAGTTKYPTWRSVQLAWDGITSFSGAPLRLVSFLGVLCCIGGVVWVIDIVASHYFGEGQVPGWASVMAAVLLMGGAQLLFLGLLGQYLSRTFEESKRRPLYFVKSDSGKGGESEGGSRTE